MSDDFGLRVPFFSEKKVCSMFLLSLLSVFSVHWGVVETKVIGNLASTHSAHN